jgi:cation diffusion facilitator CzcD-associated flavoprotein CzcO
VERGPDAEPLSFTAHFLWMCQGYYRQAEGYTPDWSGFDEYEGEVIHPQTWPEHADLAGKRVVLIGSGATAATLVPAIADDCGTLTILQRSPTYFWPSPNVNELAEMLRPLDLPDEWFHEIVRRHVLHLQEVVTQLSFEEPEFVKEELLNLVRAELPEGFDIDTHFTPRYLPWRQRIARVPEGDLFRAIREGKVSIVTDEISHFTRTGIVTKSGVTLEADVVITATGFNLSVLGDIAFDVDGDPVDFAETVTYRGAMFTGVPNLVWVFGYFRASWTLRADMLSEFMVRLFDYMDEHGYRTVTPQLRPEDADMPILGWVDLDDFNPGYLKRSMDLLPRRGDKPEWQHSQDYWTERKLFPEARFDDGCLRFG